MTTEKATETYEAPKLVVLGAAEDLTKAARPGEQGRRAQSVPLVFVSSKYSEE